MTAARRRRMRGPLKPVACRQSFAKQHRKRFVVGCHRLPGKPKASSVAGHLIIARVKRSGSYGLHRQWLDWNEMLCIELSEAKQRAVGISS